MDENQKKTEALAGKENKDVQSATYDKTQNKLVDLDDILQSDYLVVNKLKNLSRFGVNNEQIKSVYDMTGNNVIGADIDIILEELEKVFTTLVGCINKRYSWIVIDLATGKEDVELSKLKCAELNLKYGTLEEIPIAKRVDTMNEIVKATVNQEKILYNTSSKEFKDAVKENLSKSYKDRYTNDDRKKVNKDIGMTEEEEIEMEDMADFAIIVTRRR